GPDVKELIKDDLRKRDRSTRTVVRRNGSHFPQRLFAHEQHASHAMAAGDSRAGNDFRSGNSLEFDRRNYADIYLSLCQLIGALGGSAQNRIESRRLRTFENAPGQRDRIEVSNN